jgi:hypothetical protein
MSTSGLPNTKTFDDYAPDEGVKTEFRLLYKGPLRAEKCDDKWGLHGAGVGRANDKHALRKHFPPQLRELWNQDIGLSTQANAHFKQADPHKQRWPGLNTLEPVPESDPEGKRYIDYIADNHQYCGWRFVPLVSESGGFTCSLDILFLRRQDPGNLVNKGDIDNRIKFFSTG